MSSPDYDKAVGALENCDKEVVYLRGVIQELVDHLDYIGWGDRWEREVSEDLRERITKEFPPSE